MERTLLQRGEEGGMVIVAISESSRGDGVRVLVN